MGRLLAPLALIAATLLTAPLAAEAQRSGRVPTVGYLSPGLHPLQEVFRDELRRLGHVEGASIAFEHRSAADKFERLPGLAKELVDLNVDVIVAQVTQAAIAAKSATASIPIVMVGVSDPVASGLVASLARPGGNVTGTSAVAAGVIGKQLELIRELVPGISIVAALWNPANRVFQQQQLNEARAAARELQLQLRLLEARSAEELESAFAKMAREPPSALLVMGDPLFIAHARQVADLALKHRLPSVSGSKINAQAGVLLTYGPNYEDAYRRAAVYVDKILKGAKPADLPVERSARFELIVNAKTARALGMTLPQSLLLRADQVIE
jgi:putative ABC transport system substrate-binding protein